MNNSLQKTSEQEKILQSKLSELTLSLHESHSTTQGLQEELAHVERSRLNITHEKKVLEEKLDNLNHKLEQNQQTIDAQNEKIKLAKDDINASETK